MSAFINCIMSQTGAHKTRPYTRQHQSRTLGMGNWALMEVRSLFGLISAVEKKTGDHGPTDGRTDGPTDGRTDPHIESRVRD